VSEEKLYTKAEVETLILERIKNTKAELSALASELAAAKAATSPLQAQLDELKAWRADREETDVIRGAGIADEAKQASLRRYYRAHAEEGQSFGDWLTAARESDDYVKFLAASAAPPAAAAPGALPGTPPRPAPPVPGNNPPPPAAKLTPDQLATTLAQLRAQGKHEEAKQLRKDQTGA
jgi:hypothetical protein